MKTSTGVDIQLLVNLYTMYNTIDTYAPIVAGKLRLLLTSSITVRASNAPDKHSAVKHYVANQATPSHVPMFSLSLHGQHAETENKNDYGSDSRSQTKFVWHNGRLFTLDTKKADNEYTPPSLVISCFGKSDKPVREFITHCQRMYEGRASELAIATISAGYGNERLEEKVDKRPLNTIDMERHRMEELKRMVEDFFDPETKLFYKHSGHPYRLGFLLYGPPGTGKTSLAMAIASHVSRTLFLIKLGGMDDAELDKAFRGLPESCVVLLEDIDSAGVYRDVPGQKDMSKPQMCNIQEVSRVREQDVDEDSEGDSDSDVEDAWGELSKKPKKAKGKSKAKAKDEGKPSEAQLQSVKKVTLSGLLNVIDGAGAKQGRLLIMTTNAPRQLDGALIRRGRIDKVIHMGYSTKETAELAFKRIFGNDPRRRHKMEAINRQAMRFRNRFNPKAKLEPAAVATYLLMHRGNPEAAVEEFPEFLRLRRTGKNEFAYDINDIVEDEDAYLNDFDDVQDDELRETADDFLPDYDEKEDMRQFLERERQKHRELACSQPEITLTNNPITQGTKEVLKKLPVSVTSTLPVASENLKKMTSWASSCLQSKLPSLGFDSLDEKWAAGNEY